jgi:hypothetical protein
MLHQILFRVIKVKEDEICRICNMHEAMRNVYKIFVRNPEGEVHSEDIGVDGRIILEWILEK